MTSSGGFWKPSSQGENDEGFDRRRAAWNDSTPLTQQRLLLPIYQHRTQILYSVEHFGVVVIQGETGSGKSTQICQYLYENGWADHGFQIACAQPRPMAAQTLARRVAQEMAGNGGTSAFDNSKVGSIVDWEDPFKCKNAPIVFTTHAVLVREAASFDPLLSQYSVILVDEIHERTLASDALLGVLQKIRRKRQDSLRIILCSATLDASACLEFFVGPDSTATSKTTVTTTVSETTVSAPATATIATNTLDAFSLASDASHGRKRRRSRWDSAERDQKDNSELTGSSPALKIYQRGTILSVDGRQFPVEVMYLSEPTPEYIRSTVETALQLHHQGDTGDILCFLPSAEDIDRAIRLAEEHLDQLATKQSTSKAVTKPSLPVFLALHSALPYHMQAEVLFHQSNAVPRNRKQSQQQQARRIIMATNMAETSVTVPNVTHVIDSGLVTLPYFDPQTGLERWLVAPVSQASAHQRAGRAARQKPGVCYRLYTEMYFLQMEASTPPEILRTNLTGLILTLKALGVSNLLSFDLMDLPSVDALSHGLECLYALGAITDQTHLTPRGLQMSAFPTDPQVARMLLESLDLQCSWEVLAVASALQIRPSWLLLPPPKSPTQRSQYHQARSEYIDASGDHVTMANIIASEHDNDWSANTDQECRERFVSPLALRRALEIRRQLAKVLRTFGKVEALGSVLDVDLRSQSIRRCVTAGFFVGNVAKLGQDGRYYTLFGGQHVMVTPSPASVMSSHGISNEYIIFGETVSHQDGTHHGGSTSGGGVQVRWCSAIEAKWLREIAPHYWQ